MSDERLDRELSEMLRAAADVELPGRLAARVASIPARRTTGRRAMVGTRTRLPIGSMALVGVVILALAWGVPRLAPGFAPFGAATACTGRPTPRPPADSGPTPTTLPATPTPSAPVGPTPTQAPGYFEPVGSMTTTRSGATATLLADDRVLIVGGSGGDGWPAATAELYDPATCTFSRTGSMPAPRASYAATLLADGRVLIAGGFDGFTNSLATDLLYDPRTGEFGATGSMSARRSGSSATLLRDGRVLVAGGEDVVPGASVPLSSAELYDPKTGKFSPTGSMVTARVGAATALLPDGRVLFVSGVENACCDDVPNASAELYDPATGRFGPAGSLLAGWASSATVLGDGRVLVLGEIRNLPIGVMPTTRPQAELYDPKTGEFAMTGINQAPGLQATLLPDSRVLVLGGWPALMNGAGNSAQLYDPKTGGFAPTGSLTTPRVGPAVALLKDGRVLVAGGNQPAGDTPGELLDSAELFQPAP